MKNPVKIINAPKGAKYLSEFLTELPQGIFNKVETGCGMTSIALQNDEPYIIAGPFWRLLENKVSQTEGVFGVDGNTRYQDFLDFIEEGGIKLMVTYDSLPKLARWLGNECFAKYKLLVDEYQVLLHQYTLRSNRFDDFIECALKFEYCTYGSATPLTPCFSPEALSALPVTEIKWPDPVKIKVARQKSARPLATVKKLLKAYKAGNGVEFAGIKSEAGIFFINSVKAIANLIESAQLKPEDVTVICGKGAANKDLLGEFYESESISAAASNKLITLVTSCGWQGIDIYSDNALSYVVTLKGSAHTLMDINTAVIQAAGRVRNENNPFKGQLVHIFNTDISGRPKREKGVSNDEYQEIINAHYAREDRAFERWIDKRIDISKLALSRYEALTQEELNDDAAYQIKHAVRDSEPYLQYKQVGNNWKVSFNDTFILVDKWKHESIQKAYRDGLTLRRAYAEAGFDITQNQTFDNPEELFEEKVLRLTFNSAFKEYVSAEVSESRKDTLASMYPLIKEAVDELGAARCGTLDYVKKRIVGELQMKTGDVRKLILGKLTQAYKSGEFVSNADLKKKLKEIYSQYEAWNKLKPKATDILDFFPESQECRETVDGKQKRGIKLKYSRFTTLKM